MQHLILCGGRDAVKLEGYKKAFLLVGEDFEGLDELIHTLRSKDIEFAGAVFPKVISGGAVRSDIAVVLHLEEERIILLPNMTTEITHNIEQGFNTLLIFVDGFAEHITDLLDRLYESYGGNITFLGGGAGSVTKDLKPIITKEGLISSGACGFLTKAKAKFRVGHGWKRFFGPLIATRTEGNRIVEINWKPAFEVYREVLKQNAGVDVKPDNFFEVSKFFPFGMIREGEEDIVRDPIRVNEDMSIECVGEVPENSVLFIMRARKEDLLRASAMICDMDTGGIRFIFDCVSRTMALEEDFARETESFGQSCLGVLTVGEIATLKNGYPMFYNKTIVCAELEL